MERICKTGWWLVAICLVWQWMELAVYGEVQPRVVDDIMMVLISPFIYKAIR